MEFLRFTFQNIWTFLGVLILAYALLGLICSTILSIVKCICYAKLGCSSKIDSLDINEDSEESIDD